MNLREDAEEYIAAALVELRGRAQPSDLATLSELLLDVRDAQSDDQIVAIHNQAKNLRSFCENRLMSRAVISPVRHR